MSDLTPEDHALLERLLALEVDVDSPEVRSRFESNPALAEEWSVLSAVVRGLEFDASEEAEVLAQVATPADGASRVREERARDVAARQIADRWPTSKPSPWSPARLAAIVAAAIVVVALALQFGRGSDLPDSPDPDDFLHTNPGGTSGAAPTGPTRRAALTDFTWPAPAPEVVGEATRILEVYAQDGELVGRYEIEEDRFSISDELRESLPQRFSWIVKGYAPDGEETILGRYRVDLDS